MDRYTGPIKTMKVNTMNTVQSEKRKMNKNITTMLALPKDGTTIADTTVSLPQCVNGSSKVIFQYQSARDDIVAPIDRRRMNPL